VNTCSLISLRGLSGFFCFTLAIVFSVISTLSANAQGCGPCCEQPVLESHGRAWPDQNSYVEVYISTDFNLINGARRAVQQTLPATHATIQKDVI
jgi:hypothetical protein